MQTHGQRVERKHSQAVQNLPQPQHRFVQRQACDPMEDCHQAVKSEVVGERLQFGIGLPGSEQAVVIDDQLCDQGVLVRVAPHRCIQAAHCPQAAGEQQGDHYQQGDCLPGEFRAQGLPPPARRAQESAGATPGGTAFPKQQQRASQRRQPGVPGAGLDVHQVAPQHQDRVERQAEARAQAEFFSPVQLSPGRPDPGEQPPSR